MAFRLPGPAVRRALGERYLARLRQTLPEAELLEFQPDHDWLHEALGAGPRQEGIVFAAEECIAYDTLSPIFVFAEAVSQHAFPEDVISWEQIVAAHNMLATFWKE